MNNRPPINESLADDSGKASPGWGNWFNQVFSGMPWKKGRNVTVSINFATIVAQSQAGLTATVTGARVGDAVQVTTLDVSGLIFTAAVTANDTVTVYAKNFSAAPIDPGSQSFRIIVLQN
jgi:hypothetical protein